MPALARSYTSAWSTSASHISQAGMGLGPTLLTQAHVWHSCFAAERHFEDEVACALQGSDAKDALLGRIFGYSALSQAGRGASNAVADRLATSLMAVMGRKSFLREAAASALVACLLGLPAQALKHVLGSCEPLRDMLTRKPDEASPEVTDARLWLHLDWTCTEKIDTYPLQTGAPLCSNVLRQAALLHVFNSCSMGVMPPLARTLHAFSGLEHHPLSCFLFPTNKYRACQCRTCCWRSACGPSCLPTSSRIAPCCPEAARRQALAPSPALTMPGQQARQAQPS